MLTLVICCLVMKGTASTKSSFLHTKYTSNFSHHVYHGCSDKRQKTELFAFALEAATMLLPKCICRVISDEQQFFNFPSAFLLRAQASNSRVYAN